MTWSNKTDAAKPAIAPGFQIRRHERGVADRVNFRAADPNKQSHAVQYVSEPRWPWQRLRKEKPGQFEKPIESAPEGDAWFHAKVVVEKRQVKVFVNGATEPSLVANELSDRLGGSVGLWGNGYGVIANLKIMPNK